MIIGITGAMGAGKSALARLLGDLGAIVIDADKLGHEVIETPPVRQALIAEFGAAIIDAQQRLDRRRLGRLAFADEQRLQRLNALVQPALEQALWQRVAADQQQHAGALLIVDAALIFEWDLARCFSLVIVVHTQENMRLARLAQRGLSPEDIQRRMAGQLPPEEKRRRADIVVENTGDLAALTEQAAKLWAKLQKMKENQAN